MTASLSRKRPSPLASEQPRTWACGIIHVLGPTQLPVGQGEPASHDRLRSAPRFGVGQSTASAKARVISVALHANRIQSDMLKRIVDQNPLV